MSSPCELVFTTSARVFVLSILGCCALRGRGWVVLKRGGAMLGYIGVDAAGL